mmetsp:Transcript_22346/g.70644  ORF Transcript_22346/g.70644 Transcript_22346/m.70644 type:complete len:583 (-) Transcript_22346:135-1883(-)
MCALADSDGTPAVVHPRLGELPESVVELLVMCLADTNYEVEAAAAAFRRCFGDGDEAASVFTADAVHSLVREMSCDGTLQFTHAAVMHVEQPPQGPRFKPPPRGRPAHLADAAVLHKDVEHTATTLQEVVSWTVLTEVLIVKVIECLGRKDSSAVMAVCRSLRRQTLRVPGMWSEAVLLEDGSSGESHEVLRSRLLRRLKCYVSLHGSLTERLAVRNSILTLGTQTSGESLLLPADLLDAGLWQPLRALQHLVLHSFLEAELMAVLASAPLLGQVVRVDLLECRGVSEPTFAAFSCFPALRELAISGLKSTRLTPPRQWPRELVGKLRELSLDPLDSGAEYWPSLCCGDEGGVGGSLERLHILTAQPRLAASTLPSGLRLLSLATRAQDRHNPWVAAFLLLDEHVGALLAGLPHLEALLLSGHVALGPGSVESIGRSHGSRLRVLGLARCHGLDSPEGAVSFAAAAWPALQLLEAPGPRFLGAVQPRPPTGGTLHCMLPGQGSTLEPRPGRALDPARLGQLGEPPRSGAGWWEAVLATHPRPLVECGGAGSRRGPNSPLADLAAPGRYLLHPGDFGEVCRGP